MGRADQVVPDAGAVHQEKGFRGSGPPPSSMDHIFPLVLSWSYLVPYCCKILAKCRKVAPWGSIVVHKGPHLLQVTPGVPEHENNLNPKKKLFC